MVVICEVVCKKEKFQVTGASVGRERFAILMQSYHHSFLFLA